MWQLLLGPVLELVNNVVDKIFPDATQAQQLKAQIALEAMKMDWQSIEGQLQINLEEAKSEKWWKSGWRPFIGWVCGIAYAYHFVLQPFLIFVLSALSITVVGIPTLDISELGVVLMGMLGLGGMRTFEKMKGLKGG